MLLEKHVKVRFVACQNSYPNNSSTMFNQLCSFKVLEFLTLQLVNDSNKDGSISQIANAVEYSKNIEIRGALAQSRIQITYSCLCQKTFSKKAVFLLM